MRLLQTDARHYLLIGAGSGMMAWIIYGVTEYLFLVILTYFMQPSYLYEPLNWGFTALLFLLYAISGLLVGGLIGLIFGVFSGRFGFSRGAESETQLQTVLTLSVLVAFSLNFLTSFSINSRLTLICMFCYALLGSGLLLSFISDTWRKRLAFVTNSWVVCMILVGLPWVLKSWLYNETRMIKGVAGLIYLIIVISISLAANRFLQKRQTSVLPEESGFLAKNFFMFLMPVVAIVLAVSLSLRQKSYIAEVQTEPARNSESPNVILITLDTVNAAHLSVYGYERDTTPNLKKFAEEATLYKNAIATGDMTLSTHASIFTGLYTREHGAHYDFPDSPDGRPLADKFTTLAECLSQKGYLTMGVVANFGYLSYGFGLVQGFQSYDVKFPTPLLAEVPEFYLRSAIRDFLTRFASPNQFDARYSNAGVVNRTAFDKLDKAKEKGAPFFLFLNYMEAHWPYLPPAPFDSKYPGKQKDFTTEYYYTLKDRVMKLEGKVSEIERNHLVSQYDGGIAYTDYELGNLFNYLKQKGLYDNSLIIVTSDHGEAFGERDFLEHSVSVYQDQVHIPLIIKYPHSVEKRIYDEFVSQVDIMPTVVDTLGYDVPGHLSGESLSRLKSSPPRILISESFPDHYYFAVHERFDRIQRAIYSSHFKFISSTKGDKELYDLSSDSDELTDLYESNEVAAEEMQGQLQKWLDTIPSEAVTKHELDKKTHERLKSLGYIK